MAEKDISEVKKWQERIKTGLAYQHDFGLPQYWNKYETWYRADWRGEKSKLPVNITYAFGKSLIPKTYAKNPRVTLMPTGQTDFLKVKVAEKVVNWYIRRIGIKEQMKILCKYNYLNGVGPMVFGYDSQYGYNPEDASPIVEGGGTLSQFANDATRIEFNTNILPGNPWALAVRPRDFVVPYGYRTLKDVPWYAVRILREVEDVRKDGRYTGAEDIKAHKRLTTVEGSGIDPVIEKTLDKQEFVELFEIRDRRERKIYVITMDDNKFLLNEIDNLQLNDVPAECLTFNDDMDTFWGIPDARIIEPQQEELNELRDQARAHRAISLLKIIGKTGALTAEEKQKLLSGEVMPYVEMDVDGPIGDSLSLLQPHVPQEFGILSKDVIEDVRQMLGIGPNQAGTYSGGRRTATEATIVQVASELRIDERRDIAADMLVSIAKRILKMLVTFQRDSLGTTDIITPEGRKWVTFYGDQLIDSYDFVVNPDEMLPYNLQLRMQNAKELFQIGRGDPIFDQYELTKHLLEQYPEANPERLLVPQPGFGNNPETPMPLNMLLAQMKQQGQGGGNAEVSGKVQNVRE